ncbi:MAG TPA: hypothetical protein DCY20_02465, partial [Firmicutes bacterium]|nr:hypothetical protein [Bacillota bacterium]
MKKRRRFRNLIFCSVILILGMSIFKAADDYRSILIQRWNITLSSQSVELYEKSNPATTEAQGLQYHIFEYQSKDSLKSSFSWTYQKNTSLEKSITTVLKSLNIPTRYYPNFEHTYGYIIKSKSNHSKIYMIYSKDS